MTTIRKEPLQERVQAMRILEAIGKHEEANKIREEIKQRLRASVGRGVW